MEGLRRDLLAWYDAHRRDLPWRAPPGVAPDPYTVFVSEVMLQQTRVETVLRRFPAWLERFPDWARLAAADTEAVMAQWAGLGYYRRARALHAAAVHVAAHGLPADVPGLQALPGVGPYMAGAVASIALGQAVPAVDGNAVRVLARLGLVTAAVDRREGRAAVEALAARLVDPQRPGDWNQALMDLGSAVCGPRPRCGSCPVAAHCLALQQDAVGQVPSRSPRRRPQREDHHYALVTDGPRVLVVARPQGLLAGTWMLPGGLQDEPLEDLVKQQAGVEVEVGAAAAARHVFTHRVWQMRVHASTRSAGRVKGRWVDPAAPDVALSAAAHKAVAAGRRAATGDGASPRQPPDADVPA